LISKILLCFLSLDIFSASGLPRAPIALGTCVHVTILGAKAPQQCNLEMRTSPFVICPRQSNSYNRIERFRRFSAIAPRVDKVLQYTWLIAPVNVVNSARGLGVDELLGWWLL